MYDFMFLHETWEKAEVIKKRELGKPRSKAKGQHLREPQQGL
jgi:hypothetical protein